MKAILMIATLLVAVSGCSKVQKMQAKREAEAKIVAVLKDPESAKFADEFAYDATGTSPHSCGSVNAKNSFGGYTGMTAYLIWQDKAYLASGEAESIALAICCETISRAKTKGDAVWDMPNFAAGCGQAAKLGSGMPFTFSES